MSGFALSYTANMFILMILYDLCLLPAQICCIITQISEVEVIYILLFDNYGLAFVGRPL
jgi:hypothetical protein